MAFGIGGNAPGETVGRQSGVVFLGVLEQYVIHFLRSSLASQLPTCLGSRLDSSPPSILFFIGRSSSLQAGEPGCVRSRCCRCLLSRSD